MVELLQDLQDDSAEGEPNSKKKAKKDPTANASSKSTKTKAKPVAQVYKSTKSTVLQRAVQRKLLADKVPAGTCFVCKKVPPKKEKLGKCHLCDRAMCVEPGVVCYKMKPNGQKECIRCTKNPPLCSICSLPNVIAYCVMCSQDICLKCSNEVESDGAIYRACTPCKEESEEREQAQLAIEEEAKKEDKDDNENADDHAASKSEPKSKNKASKGQSNKTIAKAAKQSPSKKPGVSKEIAALKASSAAITFK